jgi:hypothetical protein
MPYFFAIFFGLKAKPKILLGVAKPLSMVLRPLVGLFFNGQCSKLPSFRLISNDTLYFRYKFELRRQGGNIEHFQSFKKAGETLKKLQGWKNLRKNYYFRRDSYLKVSKGHSLTWERILSVRRGARGSWEEAAVKRRCLKGLLFRSGENISGICRLPRAAQ